MSAENVMEGETFYSVLVNLDIQPGYLFEPEYTVEEMQQRETGVPAAFTVQVYCWLGPSRTWAAETKQHLVVMLYQYTNTNKNWIILLH